MTNKLEYFSLASLSSLVLCNALVYWADLQVKKEMKCCEYGPKIASKFFFKFIASEYYDVNKS